MKTFVFAVSFAMFVSSTVHAQSITLPADVPSAVTPMPTPRIGLAPYVFLIAGQAADLATTVDNYRRGYTESNPLYGTQPSLGRIATVKAVETASLVVLVQVFERSGHPKLAKFMSYFGAVGGAVPAVINLRVGRN